MSRDEKGRNERWRHSACSWQWARLGNDGVSLSSGPGKLSLLRLRSLTTDQSELSKVEGCLVRASCRLNFTRSFLKVHFSHICNTGYSFKTTQNLPFISWSHSHTDNDGYNTIILSIKNYITERTLALLLHFALSVCLFPV